MALPIVAAVALAVVIQPARRSNGPPVPASASSLRSATVAPTALRRPASGAMFGMAPTQQLTADDVRIFFEPDARLVQAPRAALACVALSCAVLLRGLGSRIMAAANAAYTVAHKWHSSVDWLVPAMPFPSTRLSSPAAARPKALLFASVPARSRRIIATVVSAHLPPVMMASAEPVTLSTPKWAKAVAQPPSRTHADRMRSLPRYIARRYASLPH
jgi:hypothetical protein